MNNTKKTLIISTILVLLLSATAPLLVADNGTFLIEDYFLEMSLAVIAVFSIIISFLLKKSIDHKLFFFKRNDHIDI